MVTVRVNGALRTVDVEADTPVLWMLRDELRLTRTKFGGGVARSGACIVVLVDDRAPEIARPSDAEIDAALTGDVCRCVPHAHFPRKR
jgi:isoquinoline 1-oxidoreductase alpha subunit